MIHTDKKPKTKNIIIAAACVFLAAVVAAGGYAGNMFGFFNSGNSRQYSVAASQKSDSALDGKTAVFLGSSVTYGFASMGESFADYLSAQYGLIAIKAAKSGTTLVDDSDDSYVSRIKSIDRSIKPDVFVCQLSTNDATQDKPLGSVGGGFAADGFDTHTVAGAIEYIIAYARQMWGCPVIFYTNPRYDSEKYSDMVTLLEQISEKWDIAVIDLWNDEALNSLSADEIKLYMNDSIHPTRAGYRDLWTPVFKNALERALSGE